MQDTVEDIIVEIARDKSDGATIKTTLLLLTLTWVFIPTPATTQENASAPQSVTASDTAQPNSAIPKTSPGDLSEYEREVFDECRPFLTDEQQEHFATIDSTKRARFLKRNCNLHQVFEQCRIYIDTHKEASFASQYPEKRGRWLKRNCANLTEIQDQVRAERMVTRKYLQCEDRLSKEDIAAFQNLANPDEKWRWMIHRCPVYNPSLPLKSNHDGESTAESQSGPAEFAMLLNPAFVAGGLIHGLWTLGPEMQFRMNPLAAIDIQLQYADYNKGDKYSVNGFSGEAGLRIAPAKTGLEGFYIAFRIGALYLNGKEYEEETHSDMGGSYQSIASKEIRSLDFTLSLELGVAWRMKAILFNLGGGAKLLLARDVSKNHPEDLKPIVSLINLSIGPSI